MFVASRVESGDECRASVAVLPQIVGNIQAAFPVTGGKFAFVAGQVAKTGSLRVDTPVGSIRSRAHAGGFGMLSLAALTFSMMKEVHAADPSVTFLDADNIAYKDLEHGVFELVTKEAVPRHIIVEDPGQTTVLSLKGSSVSVNQSTNSAARMEELQAAQQDVIANLAKGLGPTGSGTPYFTNPLEPEPINFTVPDAPSPQNTLTPIQAVIVPIPEVIIVHPPPLPPSLNTGTGPVEIDTVKFDTFTATSGTFHASSSNSDTLSYSIAGGTAGTTVLTGVAYDVSESGSYGTLYVNSTTGNYTFVPNSNAINALQADTTQSFTITVSDGTLSASQTFTINIHGANDAAVISGTVTGSAVEAGGVANATYGTPAATGTLTDADVDNTPNTFTAVNSPKASTGGYGTFTVTAAGVWTYTIDNSNSAVQKLNVGDTLTDTFTVTSIDGTPQAVTITIQGANDAAVVSGATTGSVIEAGGVANATLGTPIATGTLTDTDVDNAPNTFTPVSCPTASDHCYGIFTMTAAGVWTYTLDNSNCTVQKLNVGDTLTDTFKVHTIDGTPQVVTITIHGTNDAAIICGTTKGSVIEAGGVANHCPGTPTGTGTLTDTDIDNPANTFTAVCSPTASDHGYGTFTMTACGVWTYTLDNSNSAVQALNVCDTLTDTFTVHTIDGTSQVVTIAIHGTNDAAVVSGAKTGAVIAAGCDTPGTPKATDTLTDTDVDNAPNTFTPVSCPTASDHCYGTFTMTAAGVWTYTLDDTNSAVQALGAGCTLTDTFTVHTIDGTAQVVTITIHGAGYTVTAGEPIDPGPVATAESDGAAVTTSAAVASSDPALNDGTLPTNDNWTWHTTDQSFKFDAAQGQIDSTGDAGVTSSGGDPTHSTEPTGGDAVIALAGGGSTEPQPGHATSTTENDFTFDRNPVRDSAGAMTIGDGAVTSPSATDITTLHAAAELLLNAIFARSSTATSNVKDPSELQEHSEMILTNAGSTNAAGTPALGDSFHFKNEISGHESSDAIDLADVDFTPASVGHRESAAGPHGALASSEGAQMTELSLPGQHSADHFSIVPDHAGGAIITRVPHDLMV
jgi:VCBS repeat-containing protein